MEAWLNPEPKFQPERLPKRVPKRIVPSHVEDADLVANWLFHNGAGGTLHDFGGDGYDGTLVGPEWRDGPYGWGLHFVRANKDRVEVAGFQAPEFSIVGWLKLDEVDIYHGIMGRADDIWSNVAYAFRVMNSNELSFVTSADGSTTTNLTSTIALEANTWYHVAATFSRPTKTLYINGVERGTQTWDNDLYSSTADVIVGGYAYGAGLDYTLHGTTPRLRFYSRELTGAKVSRMFEEERSIFGV